MEPFATIRAAPLRFLFGVAGIALVVVTLTLVLLPAHFGLWMGSQAGFQGAAYLWLYQSGRRKIKG